VAVKVEAIVTAAAMPSNGAVLNPHEIFWQGLALVPAIACCIVSFCFEPSQ
jgi:hypothetical protein